MTDNLTAEVDPYDDPDYQDFVHEMRKFCHCQVDAPCDSVLAGGPCQGKTESLDEYEGEYDEEDW